MSKICNCGVMIKYPSIERQGQETGWVKMRDIREFRLLPARGNTHSIAIFKPDLTLIILVEEMEKAEIILEVIIDIMTQNKIKKLDLTEMAYGNYIKTITKLKELAKQGCGGI